MNRQILATAEALMRRPVTGTCRIRSSPLLWRVIVFPPVGILSDYFRPGGLERIRTAVGAFAELCLATRPRDQLLCRMRQNYKKIAGTKNKGGLAPPLRFTGWILFSLVFF